MKKRLSALTAREIIVNGISLLLAVINITLVENRSRFFCEIRIEYSQSGLFDSPQKIYLFLAVCWLAGAFLFYRLIHRLLCQPDARLIRHALFWGALMAVAYVMGTRLRTDETIFGGAESVLKSIATAVCLTVLAASCTAPILKYKEPVGKGESDPEKRYPLWKLRLFYAGVIFLCWMPVFLAYYPSVFAYDAEAQFFQVIGVHYNTHHPLLHTLFLGTFFRLGGALGSYSLGMAVHSVVQMLLMASVFAYVLSYLYEKQIKRWQRMVLLAFFALFPTNSILALSTTKDVLFSALVLLYTITLYRMICERKMHIDKRDAAVYVILAVLMQLFRNNAVYAFVISVPFVLLGYWKWHVQKDGDKKTAGGAGRYLVLSAAALLLFIICSMGLQTAVHAHKGSPREMLSVPLQQMARTRVEKEEQIEPGLRQALEEYIPSKWVFAAYDPHLADPVKGRAEIRDDPAGLLKTWVKLGLKYPTVYIDAFLENSVGYWYLEDISHAQIYGIGTESGYGYLSTETRTLPAGCEIIPHSYLPGLRTLMEKIVSDNAYQKLPVLRISFAPAFYWWMLCMYMAAAIYRRKYIMLLPFFFLTAYYLTLLLSPTVLIRYMYPFVVTVPPICCCLSNDLNTNNGENIQ